jgi:2-amino-4-hydroxy-6-hydroxymethyldihydropteridine diphosphokinase
VKTKAVIALGSNLGDRRETLELAISQIRNFPESTFLTVSSFHETVALTESGEDRSKPSYLNAVCLIETTLSAQELLELCSEVEANLGRVRAERWQDRTIDLDIVAFGDQVIDTESLSVPHPRAHERLFVLLPWQEIDPDAEIVGRGKVSDLIARLT